MRKKYSNKNNVALPTINDDCLKNVEHVAKNLIQEARNLMAENESNVLKLLFEEHSWSKNTTPSLDFMLNFFVRGGDEILTEKHEINCQIYMVKIHLCKDMRMGAGRATVGSLQNWIAAAKKLS